MTTPPPIDRTILAEVCAANRPRLLATIEIVKRAVAETVGETK